jgi:hypothetical protein
MAPSKYYKSIFQVCLVHHYQPRAFNFFIDNQRKKLKTFSEWPCGEKIKKKNSTGKKPDS